MCILQFGLVVADTEADNGVPYDSIPLSVSVDDRAKMLDFQLTIIMSNLAAGWFKPPSRTREMMARSIGAERAARSISRGV